MRTTSSLIFCLLGFLTSANLQAQSSWELVWSDEFDYTGLPDAARWSYDIGGNGWGNAEEQYYTDRRRENARVDGDHLIIEARKESWSGRNYTSARLVSKTKGDWTYGRIQVRAQLPSGRGTWPAIWMLPTKSNYGNGGWPDTGEIDIMEHVGHDQGTIHATIHTDLYNHLSRSQRGGETRIEDASDVLHVYALEWTPNKLVFSIDENPYWTYTRSLNNWQGWPFDKDFHLILNLAIGGSWGGAQGIDDNIFPQKMLIDYVRVYRHVNVPQLTFEAPANIDVGGTATFSGTSTDTDGQVRRVELYQDDGLIHTIRRETDQWNWSIDDLAEGCYRIHARAIDNGGWTSHSATKPITVGNSCEQNSPYLMRPHPIRERIEAEYFDLGGPRVAYRDLTSKNEGHGIRLEEGVDVYPTTDGIGYHIGATARREWVAYTVHVDQAGIYDLQVRLASKAHQVSFSLEFDGVDKTGIIRHTNRTQNFQTVRVITEKGIELDAGTQVMKFHFQNGIPSVNWLQFRLRSSKPTFGGRIDDQIFTKDIPLTLVQLPEVTGGQDPLMYTLTPALPAGLVFDATARTLSGTPNSPMSPTAYTYTAVDANSNSASLNFEISVAEAVHFQSTIENLSYPRTHPIDPLQLPPAMGGAPPVIYTLTPILPSGLSFVDSTRMISGTPVVVNDETLYHYRATDVNGSTDSLQFNLLVYSPVNTQIESLPVTFDLRGNYPNPFTGTTRIMFDLPSRSEVYIDVIDITGRRLQSIPAQTIEAGRDREIRLSGVGLPSGMYVYRLRIVSSKGTKLRSGHFIHTQ